MPKLNKLGPAAALALLAGCNSESPPSKPLGNISEESGAQAGDFREPADNSGAVSDNAAAPPGNNE